MAKVVVWVKAFEGSCWVSWGSSVLLLEDAELLLRDTVMRCEYPGRSQSAKRLRSELGETDHRWCLERQLKVVEESFVRPLLEHPFASVWISFGDHKVALDLTESMTETLRDAADDEPDPCTAAACMIARMLAEQK